MYSRIYTKIAETYFGKTMGADEVVHHIDGDRGNNDPENLVIMKRIQHSKLHGDVLAKCYGDWMKERYSIGMFKQLVSDNKRLLKEIKKINVVYGDAVDGSCRIGKIRWLEKDNKRLRKDNESLERLNKKLRKTIDFLEKQ